MGPPTQELKRFLTLKVLDNDLNATILSPSFRVDTAWHELLLRPQDYVAFCTSVLPNQNGQVLVIGHNPLGGDDEDREERHARTLERYEEVFGEEAPSDF